MREHSFVVAIALTQEYIPMACGLLAKLRDMHSDFDLYIITNQESYPEVVYVAEVFEAESVVVSEKINLNHKGWGEIVSAKLLVFGLPTLKPIIFLDVDQILLKPLNSFIHDYINSNVEIAGAKDNKQLGGQFIKGKLPKGLGADWDAINTVCIYNPI